MKRFTNYTDRRGSVSLETAISFSLVLVFLTAIISVTVFLRTDILMQRAVNKTCEDFSHLMPFSIVASDTISTLVNALPDEARVDDAVVNAGSVIAGADMLTSGALRAGALNLMLGDRFTDDIATEFNEYNGSYFWGPDDIYVDFDIRDSYIEVYVVYSINTIIGPMQRQIVSSIPFYGDFELFLSEGEDGQELSDDIWHQNNFTRGRAFAERYGANLPPTFPCVNYYRAGEVGSIVSIDLNKPTYSIPGAVVVRLTEQIDSLADFDGADVQISGERYVIYGDSIRVRTLVVVIPEDSPESLRASVYSMEGYAAIHGINLQVEEYGLSS
ncbi:MAG: hypothetical protein J6127_05980 [Clostridiales bacterium]|nr:hypothetical protein [Clostridiales bacterium]